MPAPPWSLSVWRSSRQVAHFSRNKQTDGAEVTDLAVPTMTEADARRLTERIRLTAHTFAESRAKLIDLVEEAKTGNAHAALGYASWTAYLSDVLGDEPLRLARDDRKELVGILASEGMSTRAIAPIVGTDQATVVRDLSTDANASVERPSTVTSLDGRQRPSTRPDVIRVDQSTGEVLEATPQPEPRAVSRRQPLPDEARVVGWVLRKAVERIQEIGADDRFPANKEAMAPHLRSHLTNAIEVCQDLLDRINQ